MDGFIGVISEFGVGLIFFFDVLFECIGEVEVFYGKFLLVGQCIFIVDDIGVNGMVFEEFFGFWGVEMMYWQFGVEVFVEFRIFGVKFYNFVIFDYQMLQMNGRMFVIIVVFDLFILEMLMFMFLLLDVFVSDGQLCVEGIQVYLMKLVWVEVIYEIIC